MQDRAQYITQHGMTLRLLLRLAQLQAVLKAILLWGYRKNEALGRNRVSLTVTPPPLAKISGRTTMPLSLRMASASGVVGPCGIQAIHYLLLPVVLEEFYPIHHVIDAHPKDAKDSSHQTQWPQVGTL